MINIVDLLIGGLAVFRISYLLAYEAGPFDVFGKLRHLAGLRFDKLSQPIPKTELAKGMICLYCNSMWIGILGGIVYNIWPPVVWLCLPFALSSIAIIIFTFVDVK